MDKLFLLQNNSFSFMQGNCFITFGYKYNNILYITSNINYSQIPYCIFNNINTINITNNATLIIDINTTLQNNITTIEGNGTLQINSGINFIISNNITLSISTIQGNGTLTIASSYTLTQGSSITLSISLFNVIGTWNNNGYNITIPINSIVNINIEGKTNLPAGTLTVNGTLYWTQANLLPSLSSSTISSFPLTLAGTGIMIAGYNYKSSASNSISFSSTSIGQGATDGSGITSGNNYQYYVLSNIMGSNVGLYCIGINSTKYYYQNALIYIGTANTTYSVSQNYYWSNQFNAPSGQNVYAINIAGGAGIITLTGKLYI